MSYEDIQISEGVIHRAPPALADNPLDLHNSSFHTQPRAIIAQELYSVEFKAAQAKLLDFWLIYSN